MNACTVLVGNPERKNDLEDLIVDRIILTFRHHASYIYRTDVPLLPRVRFLYI